MIPAAWSARYVSGRGADPLDGSSPPLASADLPRPSREASSASSHPVLSIGTEEQEDALEERVQSSVHDPGEADLDQRVVAALDGCCSSSNLRRTKTGYEVTREGSTFLSVGVYDSLDTHEV